MHQFSRLEVPRFLSDSCYKVKVNIGKTINGKIAKQLCFLLQLYLHLTTDESTYKNIYHIFYTKEALNFVNIVADIFS